LWLWLRYGYAANLYFAAKFANANKIAVAETSKSFCLQLQLWLRTAT
jgi:hypothetical protein